MVHICTISLEGILKVFRSSTAELLPNNVVMVRFVSTFHRKSYFREFFVRRVMFLAVGLRFTVWALSEQIRSFVSAVRSWSEVRPR